MFDRTVKHHPSKKHQFSRRQILFGLGAVGSVATLGLCGSASAAAYLLGREVKFSRESQTPIAKTATPTASPEPAPPHPQIVSRAEWGALVPDHEAINEFGFYSEDNPEGWFIYENELQDAYQTAIIHHAAFYEETDLRTVKAIQDLHRIDRGWADVAYHFMVGRTGVIYEGRDWTVRGTHVASYNTGSLGVCLLGNFMNQHPTDAQIASTRRLLIWVAYRLQLSHIAAHRTFNALTQCPGDNLFSRLPEFAAAANLQIGTAGYIPPDEALDCTCCTCNSD
ncbi:MAG: peptidoglycan recognition family protein [Anaerolineae bacterium]|nr:peptidoglycan recognition family protein [Anaerolineae bacterium]